MMTKRDSRIDLYRIIATIFVVALHILGVGGVSYNTPLKRIVVLDC